MTASVQERVAAGAAALDKINPGWESKVNPDTLNVSRADACVLGQVYGFYFEAPYALTDHGPAYGFYDNVSLRSLDLQYMGGEARQRLGAEVDAEYKALTAAWKDLLAARRAPAQPVKEATFEEVISQFEQVLTEHVLVRA
jgi:hypothetical protein